MKLGAWPKALAHKTKRRQEVLDRLNRTQSFTSTLRMADQLPAAPAELFARTRHHMVRTGSVLVENVDAVTVWFTSQGEGNEELRARTRHQSL